MRVIVFGSYADSLINFRGDLIRHLVGRGHTVFAVAPTGSAGVTETLASWNVEFLSVDLERSGTNPLRDLKLVLQLRQLFTTVRPDTVLAYTVKPVVYGALAAKWSGVRCFAAMITGLGFSFSATTSPWQSIMQTCARFLYRAAMRYSSIVIFQNPDDHLEFSRQELLNIKHRVIVTRGSGVNLQHFRCSPMPELPFRFLMVSRLVADKGVREYLGAAALVKHRHPDVHFDLVGPTDAHPSAISREEITAAVSNGTITYHGPAVDVRPFLEAAHVFVLPSYREGTPRSVLEAMAVGRPIITTNTPGCRETVVERGNGILVAPRSVSELSSAMFELIAAQPLDLCKMASLSRSLAESRFDVNVVNAQISAVLEAKQ